MDRSVHPFFGILVLAALGWMIYVVLRSFRTKAADRRARGESKYDDSLTDQFLLAQEAELKRRILGIPTEVTYYKQMLKPDLEKLSAPKPKRVKRQKKGDDAVKKGD